MRLARLPEPFSHPDWLFELKHDGFRALAVVRGRRCTLFSRNGRAFKQWPQLTEEIAHSVRTNDAILDGEISCLDPMHGATSMRCCGAANGRPALWQVHKNDRKLRCVVVQLPTGHDLRLMEGDDFRRTQLCKEASAARELSEKWGAALFEVAWTVS